MPNMSFPWWLLVMPVVYLLMAVAFAFPVWMFCGDEGFYALAARSVLRGMRPYRDFLFVQMPFMNYAYAAWFTIFGSSIESGRWFTILLTVAGMLLAILACLRLAGPRAAMLAGALWLTSMHLVTDLTAVRTQPICNVLLCGTIFCLCAMEGRVRWKWIIAAMALMTLGFLTRLTLVVPLVLLWGLLAWTCRRHVRPFLMLLALNMLAIVACIGFFWADGNFWFDVYRTHRDYWGAAPWTWTRLGWTVKGWLNNQLVIVMCFACGVVRFVAQAIDRREWPSLLLPAWLLTSYWGVTYLHWSQVQNYPTHQTAIVSLAIVFSALVLGPLLDRLSSAAFSQLATAFAMVTAICIPFSLSEFVFSERSFRMGKDSFIGEALRIIAKHAEPNARLLTFNAELAVNGGYEVQPGCEQSSWSYFAQLPDDLAAKYRALNANALEAALRDGDASILTVTDWDFGQMAAGSPERAGRLKKLIDDGWQNVGIVKKYGQFLQDLYVFKRIRREGKP
jgi:4-amino-4-deoxy-L-arabinose transferase-like glycosyltransferase